MKRSCSASTGDETRKNAPTTAAANPAVAAPLSSSRLYQSSHGHAVSAKTSAKRETELAGFLHQVSARYQRIHKENSAAATTTTTTRTRTTTPATIAGAVASGTSNNNKSNKLIDCYRNTGSRPVSSQDFSEKLAGRALTLVGGGFTKSAVEAAIAPKMSGATIGNRWNPRLTKRQRRETLPSRETKIGTVVRVVGADPKRREQVHLRRAQFLDRMNQLWNEYAADLLLVRKKDAAPETISVNRSLAGTAEWVGARIRIESCASYPALVGRAGYVVAITRNTWCVVAMVARDPIKDKRGDSPRVQDGGGGGTGSGDPAPPRSPKLRQYYVPKRKSSLSVLLPVIPKHTQSDKARTPEKTHEFISILLNLEST